MMNWHEQEVPDFEGIYISKGEAYSFENGDFTSSCVPSVNYSQDVVILCSFDVPNSNYRIHGGEASGHGSIGVVILEDKISGEAIWSMLSSKSNPFYQISDSKQQYSLTSTNGSTFNFELPLNKPKLKLS